MHYHLTADICLERALGSFKDYQVLNTADYTYSASSIRDYLQKICSRRYLKGLVETVSHTWAYRFSVDSLVKA